MLDHVSVQVADVEASAAFYTEVFAPVGVHEVMRFQRDGGLVVGLAGPDGAPHLWLGPAETSINRELHIAISAEHRSQVDAVHDAAVAAGAEVLHAPMVWPEYHRNYYAVFLRDPDGNNVEAVSHHAGG